MLRSITTIARQHSLKEEELRSFLIKKNFNLIPFKNDYLAHPWTVKEILDNFKASKKTKK